MKRHRVGTALVTAGAFLASTIGISGLASTPASADSTNSFASTCIATAPFVGDQTELGTMTLGSVGASSVTAGSSFQVTLKGLPGSFVNAGTRSTIGYTMSNLNTLRFSWSIPTGATVTAASIVPGTGLNVPNTGAASTVNITGGLVNYVGNGARVLPVGAITSAVTTNYRLPDVLVTMTVNGAVDSTISTKLDGTNKATGGWKFNSVAKALGSDQVAPTSCYPSTAGAATNFVNIATIAAPAATTTTVTGPTNAINGTSTDLTATVTGSPSVGTVQFKDGGTDIGSPVSVASGAAGLAHTFNTNGAHNITAVYSGGSGFAGSTSAIFVTTVTQNTSTSLSVPASAVTGTPLDLTATVSPNPGGGTVQFKDGDSDLGSPVAVSGGSATLNHAFGTNGTHGITAVFSGNGSFNGSTAGASNVAVTTNTTTALSVPSTTDNGEAVDLTANVTPSGATGSVQFKDGGTDIGAPVVVTGGSATLNHTFTSDGSHAVTATFTGTGGFNDSTASASNVSVSTPAEETTTALTVPSGADTGESVTISATVSPAPSGGTVSFYADGDLIGSDAVDSGVASIDYAFDPAGGYDITAEYSGTTGYLSSSAGPETIVVADPDIATATAVTVPGAAETNTDVVLSATVSPAPAGGTVEFFDGATSLGTGTVDSGVASITVQFAAAGTHSITAAYSGSGLYLGSQSDSSDIEITEPVVLAASATDLDATPSVATNGDSVELTATVVDPAATGTPTGDVEFFNGATSLGTDTLDGSGTATLSTSVTGVEGLQFTAVYQGDLAYNGSQGQQFVSSAPVGGIDNAAIGSMTIQASAEAPIVAPIPSGSNYVSLLTETAGVTDLGGVFEFAPQVFQPVPGVAVYSSLAQVGTATGSVDAEGDATLTTSIKLQLHGIDAGFGVSPFGDDCVVGPISLSLTGTKGATNLVTLEQSGFSIPALADDACGGAGANMNSFFGGTDTVFSIGIQLPYTSPPGMPNVLIGNGSVVEGNAGTTQVVVPVTLSEASASTVTVNWATGSGAEPTAGMDYEAASGTVTFLPGETAKSVSVTVFGDTIDESGQLYGSDWLSVVLSSPTNANLSAGLLGNVGFGLIFDDDPAPTVSIGTASVVEGNAGTVQLVLPVTLSNPSGSTVTANWLVGSGAEPTAGTDYEAASGTVTFLPGETAKSVSVTVFGDTIDEPGQLYGSDWLSVVLSSPTNAKLKSGPYANVGFGLIIDDD